jgi:hypothetical protein
MKSVISEFAGFKYTATLDHVEATPGAYALTISTTYDQARQPAEARTALKLTLGAEGLQALRAVIDDQLNETNRLARQAKDRQRLKFRNCDFQYRCTKTWDELAPVKGTDIARECSECNKLVHLCTTDDELAEAIRDNHCVAIATSEHDNQPMPLGMPKAVSWVPPSNS